MQKNRVSSSYKPIFPITGSSSLLVIFAVLCFTTFTLLALSTALADNRLAKASTQAVSDYYIADLEAETILAQLRSGVIPECVQVQDNHYSYSCTISETQALMVEVIPEPTTNTWHILRWQAVSTINHSEDTQ